MNSPQWVYDTLMAEIEPELMSTTINALDEKYKDESEEDRAARMERYQRAFIVLEECLRDLDADLQMDAQTMKTMGQWLAQRESGVSEAEALQTIEQSINTFPADA